MLRRLGFVLIIIAGVSFLAAQDWIPFTSSNPQAPFIDPTLGEEPAFMAEIYGMYSENISEAGTVYNRISIPDWFVTDETGKPEVPVIRQLLAIPESDSISLSANVTNEMFFDNYNIYPSPDFEEIIHPDGYTYLKEVFSKNDTIYNTNDFFPNVTAEIREIGYIREQKVAEILLYPIQFNPITKQLKVNTNYYVEIVCENRTSSICINTGIFSNICKNTLLNYTLGGKGASDNNRNKTRGNVEWLEVSDTSGLITADYLIITADDFFDVNNPNPSIESLANHRATYNGFDVAIVNVEDVLITYECISDSLNPAWDNERKIRNFMKSVYENGTAYNTFDNRLAYVLLIGDTEGEGNAEFMPVAYDKDVIEDEYNLNYASDYYYSCVTNFDSSYDSFGDVFIGRICVDDAIELQNLINKTIEYESEDYFSIWQENVLLTAGDVSDIGWGPGGLNPSVSATFNVIENSIPLNYDVTQLKMFEIGQTATRQFNVENVNQGDFWLNYYGHGNVTNWQSFYPSDYQQLNNGEKQPLIISIACKTGWFDHASINDCMGEYFTVDYDKGAIGYLGASRNAGSTSGLLLIEYINTAFWEHEAYICGEFITEAMNQSYYLYNRFNYNFFGDPALNLMAKYFTAKTPENVIIQEIGNNITINWNSSEGATGYSVYSSDNPLNNFQFEATVSDTTWSTQVQDGRKFFHITSLRDVD
jgi:hypothetical protein